MGVEARSRIPVAPRAMLLALLWLALTATWQPALSAGAWIGVQVQDLTLESATARDFSGQGGVLAAAVVPGGPAAQAGLRAGDIIVEVDGRRLSRTKSLVALVGSRKPGKRVAIVSYRDGQRRQTDVLLGDRATAERSIVSDESLDADYDRGYAAYEAGDHRRAAEVMERLAEHGDVVSRFFIGYLHALGQGVPKDPQRAAYWYRLAAESGFVSAQLDLALKIENGDGVARDLIRAYYWYDRAALNGSEEAAVARDRVAGLLSPQEIREAAILATLVPESAATAAVPEPQAQRSPKAAEATYDHSLVREIQRRLAALGFDPGPADGLMGRRTGSAIAAYQTERGLTADGRPDSGLLAVLRAEAEATARSAATPPPAAFAAPAEGLPTAPAFGATANTDSNFGDDLGDLDDF